MMDKAEKFLRDHQEMKDDFEVFYDDLLHERKPAQTQLDQLYAMLGKSNAIIENLTSMLDDMSRTHQRMYEVFGVEIRQIVDSAQQQQQQPGQVVNYARLGEIKEFLETFQSHKDYVSMLQEDAVDNSRWFADYIVAFKQVMLSKEEREENKENM